MLVTITRTLASGPYRPAARLLTKLDGVARIRRLGLNLRYSYKVITEVARRPDSLRPSPAFPHQSPPKRSQQFPADGPRKGTAVPFRAFIRNKCCCTRSSPDSGSRP